MECRIYPLGSLKTYKYVVALSFYQGRIVLSRHQGRSTWETQGGHIERGETPGVAARRELWEESGALEYTLTPVCDYWAGEGEKGASGQVFAAHIKTFGEMPQSEMAEIRLFSSLPKELTYPDITPVLFRYYEKAGERPPRIL